MVCDHVVSFQRPTAPEDGAERLATLTGGSPVDPCSPGTGGRSGMRRAAAPLEATGTEGVGAELTATGDT